MKEMHIAVVFGSLYAGGAERVMINLANGFVKNNIRCSIVVLNGGGPMRSEMDPSVELVSLNCGRARRGINSFRKFLKRNNPDAIILAQTHIQLMAMMAIKISRWKGITILNEHSLIEFNVRSKLQQMLIKVLFRYADAITAVSEAVSENFRRRFPSFEKKLTVIYNASFTGDILTKSKENVEIKTGAPFILAAGRLTASKNYRLLLDAFKIFHKKISSRLIILGDGELRKELESYANELGISNDVIFTGHVLNPFAYMSKCSAFVMTSDYEGLPTVLIEALACCCKIVCTKGAGGAHEILADGKYGVMADNDPDQLAIAIADSIFATGNCNEKLQRAMEFSAGHAVSKYLELINSLR